jgi:hypothetical protein
MDCNSKHKLVTIYGLILFLTMLFQVQAIILAVFNDRLIVNYEVKTIWKESSTVRTFHICIQKNHDKPWTCYSLSSLSNLGPQEYKCERAPLDLEVL